MKEKESITECSASRLAAAGRESEREQMYSPLHMRRAQRRCCMRMMQPPEMTYQRWRRREFAANRERPARHSAKSIVCMHHCGEMDSRYQTCSRGKSRGERFEECAPQHKHSRGGIYSDRISHLIKTSPQLPGGLRHTKRAPCKKFAVATQIKTSVSETKKKPLPTGCFPVCAPHCYDRWRTNMRDPELVEG
ncbi:unnamed protein product [Pleuronectes platessa]|uniref:Uncharacterized protein n=1 Tax=Pleuronectes platessa TaxID=8262 RepID=A0A9N7VGB5_PLEPL|nr:unnamed protein product [Pleuronectes platessa]